jgi:hypothetical protein
VNITSDLLIKVNRLYKEREIIINIIKIRSRLNVLKIKSKYKFWLIKAN